MFEGFATHRIAASGAEIFLRSGGQGPPLLLLHGYPQTHAIWHRVAPALAERFTVVCADLRGYGDSAKPDGGPGSRGYAKRAMAQDMVEVMAALGHERFMRRRPRPRRPRRAPPLPRPSRAGRSARRCSTSCRPAPCSPPPTRPWPPATITGSS